MSCLFFSKIVEIYFALTVSRLYLKTIGVIGLLVRLWTFRRIGQYVRYWLCIGDL